MVIAAIDESDDWTRLLAGDSSGAGELFERYAALVAAGPGLVLGQLGQSLDGFIASRTGDARFVTGAADREHLHRLRALVDAVVVGVNTVVADDPWLTVRDVPGASPVRVILDPDARTPSTSRVMVDAGTPTLWIVSDDTPPISGLAPHVDVVQLSRSPAGDGFGPNEVLRVLAQRGLTRVLVEGGGVTVSRFVASGVIDRLWVTTAPLLIGDGVPGLRFAGADRLAHALRAPSRRFMLGDDWRSNSTSAPLSDAGYDLRVTCRRVTRRPQHRVTTARSSQSG